MPVALWAIVHSRVQVLQLPCSHQQHDLLVYLHARGSGAVPTLA